MHLISVLQKPLSCIPPIQQQINFSYTEIPKTGIDGNVGAYFNLYYNPEREDDKLVRQNISLTIRQPKLEIKKSVLFIRNLLLFHFSLFVCFPLSLRIL